MTELGLGQDWFINSAFFILSVVLGIIRYILSDLGNSPATMSIFLPYEPILREIFYWFHGLGEWFLYHYPQYYETYNRLHYLLSNIFWGMPRELGTVNEYTFAASDMFNYINALPGEITEIWNYMVVTPNPTPTANADLTLYVRNPNELLGEHLTTTVYERLTDIREDENIRWRGADWEHRRNATLNWIQLRQNVETVTRQDLSQMSLFLGDLDILATRQPHPENIFYSFWFITQYEAYNVYSVWSIHMSTFDTVFESNHYEFNNIDDHADSDNNNNDLPDSDNDEDNGDDGDGDDGDGDDDDDEDN